MPANTMKNPRRYWLFKTEANCFSVSDLAAQKKQTTFWDGVRNYQARNMLRDDVQKGDLVFLYHSNSDPLAITGICEVVRAAYPDHTAFEKSEQHYDPKSDPENPTWYMVDIQLKQAFEQPVTRDMLKARPELADMVLLQKGSRLSISPVTPSEWKTICQMAGATVK